MVCQEVSIYLIDNTIRCGIGGSIYICICSTVVSKFRFVLIMKFSFYGKGWGLQESIFFFIMYYYYLGIFMFPSFFFIDLAVYMVSTKSKCKKFVLFL